MSALSEIEKNQPVEVFFSYSHRDEALRDELEKHLSSLQRRGIIGSWHDREITAGTEWAGEIDEHLNSARVILLLISADFMASQYCYDVELKRAMQRHIAGDARVIPVILRPVDWRGASFSKLQALPRNAKAVTSWENLDEAFFDVTQGISKAIEKLTKVRRELPIEEADIKRHPSAPARQRLKTQTLRPIHSERERPQQKRGNEKSEARIRHHSGAQRSPVIPPVSSINPILDMCRQIWGFLLLVLAIWVLVGQAIMLNKALIAQRWILWFVGGAGGGLFSGFIGGLALGRIDPSRQLEETLLSWMLSGVLGGALGWFLVVQLVDFIAFGSLRDNGMVVGLIFGLIAVILMLWQLNLQRSRD
ncbi:MAG: toll/interleukin-1 receptor domain-containing protein [Leptolyngbyaceae cyanobacterium MO_188.B28]|nr:toll/interleukin-1 receptor domain-containing protein [Leptolyngbyaceae cyanobacterium MO_188.B28]